jgi:microsomal epoxide hydrolase
MQTVKLDRVIAMTPPHSFTLDVPEKTIAEIKKRVAAFPWHEMPDDGGWEYGVNLNYMREFCTYWVENFDWFKQQDAINRPQSSYHSC